MAQSVNTADDLQEKKSDTGGKERSELSEIIENSNIDEDDKEKIIAYMREEEFRGPIPHPQILQQYEEVQPGLAGKIVEMALKEQLHRHELENKLVTSEVSLNSGQLELIRASISLKSRLQIFGFIATILLLAAGFVCIFLDKNVGSIGAFILAVGSFCWTMFYGKKSPDENQEDSSQG